MASAGDLFSNGNCLVCGHSSTAHGPPQIPLNSATSYTVRAVCSICQAAAQTTWENAMIAWIAQNPTPSPSKPSSTQPTLYTLCEKVFSIPVVG